MRCTRRAFSGVLAATLAMLSWPSLSRATVVVPVTVAELTRRSDDVVLVTVRRGSSRWDGGHIVTDHELDVLAVLKGRLPPRALILARLPGGVVNGIGQYIPGAATLETGRNYVVFLSGGIGDVRYLAHLTAAVMTVEGDLARGAVRVVPGEGVLPTDTPLGRVGTGAPCGLDALASAVRSALP